MHWNHRLPVLALCGGLSGLLACGGTQPPAQDLTQAKSTVRAAEEVGAEEQPEASVYLKLARDQIARAEALIKEDENEKAVPVLERAEMDARVALELAKTNSERQTAKAAWLKVEELKAEK